jgi:hypothetical protein
MSTVVGVITGDDSCWDSTTFRALEAALPVRFELRRAGNRDGISGLIVVGNPPASAQGFGALPRLHFDVRGGESTPGEVVLTQSRWVPQSFRGLRLVESIAPPPLTSAPSDEVLALSGGSPVWVRRPAAGAVSYVTSVLPEQLKPGESLRDHFCARRFFSLLPLLDFVHMLLREAGWEQPPLRASFMFDDPNLHWTSYGYIDFDRVRRHAARHGYHVAAAMVPRDMWYAHRTAANIFRENNRALSLLIHGNNHVRRELGREMPAGKAAALARQAVRRTAAFERRTGIPVSRVMAAPHGTCSEQMLSALLAAGFEAICIGGAQPWLHDGGSAGGRRWHSADLVRGLPVIPRFHFDDPPEDVVFRAFLRQPLVVYGHHNDLAAGLELLEGWSSRINSLGEVRWMSLDRISRTNVITRREGTALRLRLFTRQARVDVPEGVDELVIELPDADAKAVTVSGVAETAGPVGPAAAVRVSVSGPGALDVRSVPVDADVDDAPRLIVEPFAFARRVLAEGRDRVLPLLRPVEP